MDCLVIFHVKIFLRYQLHNIDDMLLLLFHNNDFFLYIFFYQLIIILEYFYWSEYFLHYCLAVKSVTLANY